MADTPLAHSPTLAAPASAPVLDPTRLVAGTAVGEYVVDDFLGAGAMGEVYAGHHPVIGKKVAIKVLRKELATSEEAAERFTREARAVNQVDHPNVIDVFAYGRLADGRLYLVMALVAGESLRARLADGALEVGDALAILEQIAEALDAAHERGVVHRDLKPDNIMIAPPQRVFVLDFGIAKLVDVAAGGDLAKGNGTLTGQGTWLGTPAYMAPEQWSTDGAGPASDRYALGVIAFELLSGALPFAASSVPGMMEQHFRAKVPALSMRGSTSPAIDEVMQRALAKDPDARFASGHELVAALRTAAGTSAGRVSVEPEQRPKRALYAVLGVGTLGVCIAGAVAMTGKTDPKPAVAPIEPPAPANTVAIEISSTPDGATIALAGKPVGATPRTIRVERGAHVDLVASKPGYLTSKRAFDAGTADSQLALNLGAVTRFEGVWKMPNGELRAFQRTDERVAISKLASVHGTRELWKFYPFVAADSGVAFAVEDEVIDPRAPNAPTCHVQVHVEYRYDAASDTLELRRPTVKLDFIDGQCVTRSQEIVAQRLVRVDAPRDSVEIEAPAGNPNNVGKQKPSKPVPKFPTAPSAKSKKAASTTKSVVPFDQKTAPNDYAPSAAQNEPFTKNQQIMPPVKATPPKVEVGPQTQQAIDKK